MNKTALSVVALAVGAILLIGLFNVYKPQTKNVAYDVFDKVKIPRMLGEEATGSNPSKPKPSNSRNDNSRSKLPKRGKAIDQDWSNPDYPSLLNPFMHPQILYKDGSTVEGRSSPVWTAVPHMSLNSRLDSGIKGWWSFEGTEANTSDRNEPYLPQLNNMSQNQFIYERDDGALFAGAENPEDTFDQMNESWHLRPLDVKSLD